MPIMITENDKQSAKLAQKSRLLKEIKYYEKRIEELRAARKPNSFEDDNSSSEEDIDISINIAPSLPQLLQQQSMLKTCLQATQELTGLEILQIENIPLLEPPTFEGSPIKEPGTWKEVIAECSVDFVPFTMTFYLHEADRKFAPRVYRSLNVALLKTAHRVELAKSVLATIKRPSDAVEVICSYAVAARSRRSTLSRLADKFGGELHMEPLEEGGYELSCANLLVVKWSLQNKWSPLVPFTHRMKFELEYMDESYVKTISQLHRQICDPEIGTDERTMLLAKIISTCLEAQGPTRELHESMSSDPETAKKLQSRRTTLDKEPDIPQLRSNDDLMAPPKGVPKRKSSRRTTLSRRFGNVGRKFGSEGGNTEDGRKFVHDDQSPPTNVTTPKNITDLVSKMEKRSTVNDKTNDNGGNNKTNSIRTSNKDSEGKITENSAKKAKNSAKTTENAAKETKTSAKKPKKDSTKVTSTKNKENEPNSANKQKKVTDDKPKSEIAKKPKKPTEAIQKDGNIEGDVTKKSTDSKKDSANKQKKVSDDDFKSGVAKKSAEAIQKDSNIEVDGTKKSTDGKKQLKHPSSEEDNGNTKKPKLINSTEKVKKVNSKEKLTEDPKNKPNNAEGDNVSNKKVQKIPSVKKIVNTVQKNKENLDNNSEKQSNVASLKNAVATSSKIAKKIDKPISGNVARNGEKASVATSINKKDIPKPNLGSKIVKKPVVNKNSDIINRNINSAEKLTQKKSVANLATTKFAKKVTAVKDYNVASEKNTEIAATKNIASNKNNQNAVKKVASTNNLQKKNSANKLSYANTKTSTPKGNKNLFQSGKPKTGNPQLGSKWKPGSTEKENNLSKNISKIPQKNPALAALKNNPLRMSPRRTTSGKLSNLVQGATMPIQRTLPKPATHIPRLAGKPTTS